MITGDNERSAKAIGKLAGVDEVIAGILPEGKEKEIARLKEQGSVIMVGDGINDAPVLARSDIGIAMGGVGSDVAIEAADVVLMSDDITAIAKAIDVSHYTNFILKENVTFTLIIKIGVLILTLFGLTNMWMGCNSMRILYKKS